MAQFNMADWLVDRHVREGRAGGTAIRCYGCSTTYEELRDIIARVGGQPLLAGYQRPREIRIVKELPKTAVGKIQRVVLRERLEEQMTRRV